MDINNRTIYDEDLHDASTIFKWRLHEKKNYRRRILVVWTRALTTAKLSLWKVRDSFDRSPGDVRTITLQNYSLDSWSYHIQTITVEVSDSFEINPDHIKTVALHR